MRASSAPPRLLRASAPLALAHWTIPVHPTVFSPPPPACKKLRPAGLQPAPCTFPHLQSLPVKASPASVVGLLLLPLLLHNPALDHLKSHETPPLSWTFCHARQSLAQSVRTQSYTKHLAPNTFTPASFLLTLFSLTAPQSSRSHSLNWTTARHRQSTTPTYCELPVC